MSIVLDSAVAPRPRATIDMEQFEQHWAGLRQTMDHIFLDSLLDDASDELPKYSVSQQKWQDGFAIVYTIINAGPTPHSENLYNNVRQYLLQQVGLKRHEIFQDEMDDEVDIEMDSERSSKTPILTQYHYSWKQYNTALSHYNNFFHNLNSLYVKHNRQMEQFYGFMPQKPSDAQSGDDSMDVGYAQGTQTRAMKRTANAAAAASEEAMACNGKYPIKELGLRVWKNVMDECLRKAIIPKLLQVVNAHRTQDLHTIRELMRGVTPGDITEDAVMFPVITEILKSIILPEDTRRSVSFQFYQQILEKPYFEASLEFFTTFARETRESKSTAEYVQTMLTMSELEVVRAKTFLHSQSHNKMTSMVRQIFVQDNKDFILEDVNQVIESNAWEVFQKKYIILRSVPDGLRELCKAYQTYLENEGHRRLKPYLRSPQEFVQEILAFYDQSHDTVKRLFTLEDSVNVSKDFQRAVDNACRTVVNVKDEAVGTGRPNAPASSLLAQYCDRVLKEKGQNEGFYNDRLDNAVRVFEHIEDRDLFEQFYRSKLAGRLIKNTKASMDAEKQMIENLRKVAGYDFISSLNRMMKDIQTCDQSTEDFKKSKDRYPSAAILECKIIQQGAWPFNDSKKTLIIPSELQKMLTEFTTFYQEKHQSTKLSWLYTWSSCDLSYTVGGTKYRLQAMTSQYLVLNQYNNGDSYKLSELLNATGIDYVELERTVQSLVRVELLKAPNNLHQLQLNSDIVINPDFSHKKVKIDLLKKFRDSKPVQKSSSRGKPRGLTEPSQLKQYAPEDADDEGMDAKQLEDDRRIFVQAALVRILKSHGKITHTLLISECIKAAKARFNPQISQIKQCIEGLIDKQYVERLQDDPIEIMYQYIS